MEQKFTIGIEEEYQIIDPESRDLISRAPELYEPAKDALGEKAKPEMHQCMIEIGTEICQDIQQAKRDLFFCRTTMDQLARDKDLRIVAASTHPFGHWADQKISEHERYVKLVEDMQVLSRSLLIFGMHVHVAMEDREMAIHISNAARYFLPHLLTLSTSSPFWRGIDTGLKSYRCEIFKKYPRTELPDYFSSYSEYDNFLKLLIKTNCIDDGKKIWWDLRLHPVYPTLEFRICDIPTRAEDSIAIAALVQAIVCKLYRLIKKNLGFRLYRRALLQENKWRALRYGIEGKLIDFGKQEEVPAKELIAELLEFVDDVVDDLGSREALAGVYKILERGTSAEGQLQVYRETNDLKAVVDHLIEETMVDCHNNAASKPAVATL
ncbi:MAG: carboxylate-amine ligase [Candidatus Melainabacteria bacterium]|nr:carboxylate-amine ligase [Candidatus Melainabacteria bacterium]